MDQNYTFYKTLLQQESLKPNIYWDLIVITSISNDQKHCYEKQIETKLNRNKLPAQFQYVVINDPDDFKLGSGGSTLNVIEKLYEKYKDSLFDMKILLIHAGGYSQRMPTCSILGKIFSAIACTSEDINDVLDLKLAMNTPFSVDMKPGIFLTSSDDFETFYLNDQLKASKVFGSNENDFVLIAHKSPLEIAKDHGVYALGDRIDNSDNLDLFDCNFVLQKPSIQKMKEYKIVLEESEFAYTDSVFYFSHSITKDLFEFNKTNFETIKENKIEIDAYRDFLQPLGKSQLTFDDFIKSFNRTDIFDRQVEIEIYRKLYSLFQNRKSLVLALKDSDFYHLGTLNEMIDLYLNSSSPACIKFRQSICFTNKKCSNNLVQESSSNPQGVLINSKIGSKCHLSEFSILEFCYFDDEVSLKANEYSFLSNIMLKRDELTTINRENCDFIVPSDVCMHTIPINCLTQLQDSLNYSTKYVTIFFNRKDDLKKVYNCAGSVKFMGEELIESLVCHLSGDCNTIWNLKVFKAYDSMSESFVGSIDFVNAYKCRDEQKIHGYFTEESSNFYSLFDLLKNQNFVQMISFRLENKLI